MFHKATKQGAKLRVAMFGPSGSGKTYSALRMAKGIGGKVAVIDTERGSAKKYADRFDFEVCELSERKIENYVEAFESAEKIGIDVLIIDSMSHAWEELLTEIDRLTAKKYNGNSMRAWGEGTPKQRQFIDAMLKFPGHIIATMRSDTDWVIESDSRGKMSPKKVGLKPRQGKGVEYEFDLLMEIGVHHSAEITKDRTGKYQDITVDKPDEAFGKELAEWLSDGKAEDPKRPLAEKLRGLIDEHNIADTVVMGWLNKFEARTIDQISDEKLTKIIAAVTAKYAGAK